MAYSSVSHMGFIVLGMFALNAPVLDGSVIQMVNHGLTTGALFACVGVIYERYHTREMNEVGGIWNRLPILAFFFILSALGSAAVPGLNGFVGEFPILVGMFKESRRAAVLGGTGMILGACYLFWMLRKVVFGPLREPAEHGHAGAALPCGGSPHRLARNRRLGTAHGADCPDRRDSRAVSRSHPTLRLARLTRTYRLSAVP